MTTRAILTYLEQERSSCEYCTRLTNAINAIKSLKGKRGAKPRADSTRAKIENLPHNTQLTTNMAARLINSSYKSTRNALSILTQKGIVKRVSRGVYVKV